MTDQTQPAQSAPRHPEDYINVGAETKSRFFQSTDLVTVEAFVEPTAHGWKAVQDGDDAPNTERIWIKFVRPDFRQNNAQLSASFLVGAFGRVALDPVKLRENRIVACVREWSFVDDDGRPLPVERDNIARIHPDLWNILAPLMSAHFPGLEF